MKLWVLMNSKTVLSPSQRKPNPVVVKVSACWYCRLQGRKGRGPRGWGMHEVLRGAWLNPSTSTCEFALFSAGSKVNL